MVAPSLVGRNAPKITHHLKHFGCRCESIRAKKTKKPKLLGGTVSGTNRNLLWDKRDPFLGQTGTPGTTRPFPVQFHSKIAILSRLLRLTFPRAKLRRQMFMTRAEVWAKNWAKNWAKFSAHFRASFPVQNDPQIFSQNSSQFITPCLVAEIIKFHLPEFLGLGGHNVCPWDRSRFVPGTIVPQGPSEKRLCVLCSYCLP